MSLIPPLVHRLNNSLAVIAGALTEGASEADRSLARLQVNRISESLSHLSRFARNPVAGSPASFDLRRALEAVHLVAGPLAAARGVSLSVESSSEPLLAHVDGLRLSRFLVAFVADQIEDSAEAAGQIRSGEAGVRRDIPVRISVSIRRRTASITVVRPCSTPPSPPDVLNLAADFLRDQRIEVLCRAKGSAFAYRFQMPSSGLEPVRTDSSRASGVRILLLERDDDLRELIEEVLLEAGHEVLRPNDGDELLPVLRSTLRTAADLALIDADIESQSPDLFSTLAEERSLHSRILLLGARPGREVPFSTLQKPFRPGELLAAVDGAGRAEPVQPLSSPR
ncbi:MAG TPA: response regulator transcription factor [Planctomycetes bacterium]|nr:response regulator transcription factor [Planctomycetota bacterium]